MINFQRPNKNKKIRCFELPKELKDVDTKVFIAERQ